MKIISPTQKNKIQIKNKRSELCNIKLSYSKIKLHSRYHSQSNTCKNCISSLITNNTDYGNDVLVRYINISIDIYMFHVYMEHVYVD